MSVFTVSVSLSGCGTDIDGKRWEGKTHLLTAEVLHPDRDILEAWPMVQTDEHFIFWQPENEREFSVFHLRDDSMLYDGAFLTTGRGPHEVNEGRVFYIPEQNSVVVVGYNFYGKTFVIPVDDISDLFSHDEWREYNTNHTKSSTIEVIPMDTVSYLLRIADEKRMFSMLDIRKQKKTDLDIEYPDDVAVMDGEKAYVYRGHPHKRPHHDQFVYSSGNGHYVVVYKYGTDMQVIESRVLFDELPKYSVSGGKASILDASRDGLSVTVSEGYIYLSDNNATMGDARSGSGIGKNGYPPWYVKTVYACDWDGDDVAKYELDRAVVHCSVDKNDEYLYAFAFNQETLESDLVRFRLPKQ